MDPRDEKFVGALSTMLAQLAQLEALDLASQARTDITAPQKTAIAARIATAKARVIQRAVDAAA